MHKEERLIPVEVGASQVEWHGEVCVMATVRDISERRQSEIALREREALFKSVSEGAFDGIALMDVNRRYLYVNPQMSRLLRCSAEELQSSTFDRFLAPGETARRLRVFEGRPKECSVSERCEAVLCRKDGVAIPFEISVKEIMWRGQRAFVAVHKDVSERKRLELEILRIAEWERRRIGQDLHDSIGQQLVGMTYFLEALAHGLKTSCAKYESAAGEVLGICRETHQQLRDIVAGLLPLGVDERLEDGLRRLADNVRVRMGVSCVVHDGMGEVRLNPVDESHLYQIAQEAVANAVRHGKAKRIAITLETGNDYGAIRIDDDGCGFDVNRGRTEGSGLKIMHYRADNLRGKLSVVRRDTGGMSVACTFALSSVFAEENLNGGGYGVAKE